MGILTNPYYSMGNYQFQPQYGGGLMSVDSEPPSLTLGGSSPAATPTAMGYDPSATNDPFGVNAPGAPQHGIGGNLFGNDPFGNGNDPFGVNTQPQPYDPSNEPPSDSTSGSGTLKPLPGPSPFKPQPGGNQTGGSGNTGSTTPYSQKPQYGGGGGGIYGADPWGQGLGGYDTPVSTANAINGYSWPSAYLLGQQFQPYASMQNAQTEAQSAGNVAGINAQSAGNVAGINANAGLGIAGINKESALGVAGTQADAQRDVANTQKEMGLGVAGINKESAAQVQNLVNQGILTRTEADKMIAQMQKDAALGVAETNIKPGMAQVGLGQNKLDYLKTLIGGSGGLGGLMGGDPNMTPPMPREVTSKFTPLNDIIKQKMVARSMSPFAMQAAKEGLATENRLGTSGLGPRQAELEAEPGRHLAAAESAAITGGDVNQNQYNAQNALAYAQPGITQRGQDYSYLNSLVSGRNQLKNTLLGGLLSGLS